MDYYRIIADNFQDTLETVALSVDELVAPMQRAGELMTRCLLADGKIIACGNGAGAALAQLFSVNLVDRYDRERPALPALALGAEGAAVTALAAGSDPTDIYARPLRALGQAGDVLLCISTAGPAQNLERALWAAHERNMAVVALSNSADSSLPGRLGGEDVLLEVRARRAPRVVELQVMLLHCLCELLERGLFGPGDEE